MTNISVSQLRRAIEIKEEIERLNGEIDSMFGGPDTSPASSEVPRQRGRPPGSKGRRGFKTSAGSINDSSGSQQTTGGGRMSSDAKARIAAAQKARWAAYRAQKGISSLTLPRAKKQGGRGMSAAGRARIAAAQKARWANFRKAA